MKNRTIVLFFSFCICFQAAFAMNNLKINIKDIFKHHKMVIGGVAVLFLLFPMLDSLEAKVNNTIFDNKEQNGWNKVAYLYNANGITKKPNDAIFESYKHYLDGMWKRIQNTSSLIFRNKGKLTLATAGFYLISKNENVCNKFVEALNQNILVTIVAGGWLLKKSSESLYHHTQTKDNSTETFSSLLKTPELPQMIGSLLRNVSFDNVNLNTENKSNNTRKEKNYSDNLDVD